ncbi:MAG: hypothetical protein AMXMBFR44_0210 [Candidatus Campbellbacteria bacterium]
MFNAPKAVAWSEVLKRKDLIGGEVELRSGEQVVRAPILALRLDGNNCIIDVEWGAELIAPGTWEYHNISWCKLNVIDSPAFDIGLGIVSFVIPDIGVGLVFPCGRRAPLDTDTIVGMHVIAN